MSSRKRTAYVIWLCFVLHLCLIAFFVGRDSRAENAGAMPYYVFAALIFLGASAFSLQVKRPWGAAGSLSPLRTPGEYQTKFLILMALYQLIGLLSIFVMGGFMTSWKTQLAFGASAFGIVVICGLLNASFWRELERQESSLG